MSSNIELPSALYKANLELQTRIGQLIQDSGQKWLDLGWGLLGGSKGGADLHKLLQGGDWQALATLPAESFWRQLQFGFGDSQEFARAAVEAQTAFAGGLQAAVQDWQRQTSELLGDSFAALPLDGVDWKEWFAPWQPLAEAPAAPAAAAAKKPAPARKRPAAKQAAKKAPAKKPAKRSTAKK